MVGRAYDKSLPYLAARVDRNQPDIVSTFRKLGYTVACLHTAGEGIFDLLVAKHGISFLCEVKDGLKCPSAREYTPKQKKFNFTWTGMKCVAICNEDVMSIDRQFKIIAQKIREAGICMSITGCKELQYNPSLF